MKIAIAGATGFIGSHLMNSLLENAAHEVVVLSRTPKKSKNPRVESRVCDLYSLLEIETALDGCDVGVYLVHSMSPSSRLSQGNFQDFDFILADNFAKAAQKNQLSHIVYVSGLINSNESDHRNMVGENPEIETKAEELSLHLESRLEVEKVLCAGSVPVTTLRCGLVLGFSGSSFQILRRLVQRLPIMTLPSWAETRTQVVFVEDLIKIMSKVIDQGQVESQVYDVGSPEVVTYSRLIKKTAQILERKRFFFHLPSIPLFLSKLWVALITKSPKDLVYPLIDSLVHPMTVSKERALPKELCAEYTPIDEALKKSMLPSELRTLVVNESHKNVTKKSVVQSVQRLSCPRSWSVKQVAQEYMRWLPRFFRPLIRIQSNKKEFSFCLLGLNSPLLRLQLSNERTFQGRELFYITGGLLVRKNPKARLEFRGVGNSPFVVSAIHGYRPSLPWYIYRFTQALIHAWVMKKFAQHLKSHNKESK